MWSTNPCRFRAKPTRPVARQSRVGSGTVEAPVVATKHVVVNPSQRSGAVNKRVGFEHVEVVRVPVKVRVGVRTVDVVVTVYKNGNSHSYTNKQRQLLRRQLWRQL